MPISPAQRELLKNTPIESFHWSTRTAHALESAQCKNLGDVFSTTKEGWSQRRHGGKKTVTEMAGRIQSLLKIKRPIRPARPCDTTTIEQKIQTMQISAALAEAFVAGGLTDAQVRVLELRYGLSGDEPHTLAECGRITQRTRQGIQTLEMDGRRHLSRHPEIIRALQYGLDDIQDLLWLKMAPNNKSLIPGEIGVRELYARAGGSESLLIKICHGDIRKWLHKNLTSIPKGWRIPDLNGN
jgi:hypothetical protein